MDEKVIVNLGFFFTSFIYSYIPSPALIIPFPSVNKLPNKLALNVPNNIPKNPHLCSLVSFYLFLLIKYQNFLTLQ